MAFPDVDRRRALAGSAAVAAIVVALVIVGGDDDSPAPAGFDNQTSDEAAELFDASPTTVAAVVVSGELLVDEAGFDADVLIAEVGVPFVIVNEDDEPHAWSSDDGFVSSGLVEPGESFRHVYAAPGIRTYHCEVHPDETVTVEVVVAS